MKESNTAWHSLSTNETLSRLHGNLQSGLSSEEAAALQQKIGPNKLTAHVGKPAWLRLLFQFHQPLIYILLGATVITALLKEWVDSGVILGVVIVNGLIGYIQEAKAENALKALADTMVSAATVLRDGEKLRIESSALVPGDIVYLQAGDKVPADLRIIECRDLQVDESSLTGESVAVEKGTRPLAENIMLAERSNMAYASSMVTFGRATGIVTATGNRTEVGRISDLISSAQDLATPLTKKISHFSRILLYAILLLSGITVAVGLMRDQTPFDMFMAAVALAVGAIPEGLPAAVTITLAIGVARMAKRRAIIRKLPAVETLGSTTVICSDKTGTLTENQMTVQVIRSGGVHYEVSGAGYAPLGRIVRGDETGKKPAGAREADLATALAACLRAGVLCNDSRLVKEGDTWQVQGNPTEGALLAAAVKGGLDIEKTRKQFPRLDTIPFESQHQYMATLHDMGADVLPLVYVKGAVEQILMKCAVMLDDQGNTAPLDTSLILQDVEEMASGGLRVLAFARREMPSGTSRIDHGDIADNLCFLGLQGMIDPPRAEAVAAVKVCHLAGIKVKMITGDHPATARAIAARIGLLGDSEKNGSLKRVLTGRDLQQLNDVELVAAARESTVFARATPEQKIRLVRALQEDGQVVAMTGDGVNDAPALKQADIGVAMGITGTDVSKEAADMVLTDDNFSSIEAAIEEGRGVFDNLTKFIVWTLPTNLGEGLVIMAAIFFGVTLPILPVQILWINMTTAGFLGLMLAFEPKEPGIMLRPPRDPEIPILTSELIIRIFLVGILLLVGAFGLFRWELGQGATLDQARTVAVNVFVIMELFYLFNCRSLKKSVLTLGLFSNIWVFAGAGAMLILQLLYTYLPLMNRLFQSAAIGVDSWIRIVSAGFISYLIVEVEKKIRAGKK